ncbi:hypothetical protein CK203_050975 [Vitis vinifera]|uniref:Reverse transcriptase zinc-binding domain-containing protein n=1 Tax=Vitis vinifera TaxID=29760 RepID=A0A438H2F6_VITVI|nr:hypothetical protein CK203_050975 [Vitis vinifera]
MAAQRNLTVEEMWDQSSGQGNWNLNFLRDFNDWELDTVGEFLHMLRGHKPSLEEDSVLWSIWVARVPTKVAFFAWEATWGKVLTLDRLQRRGWLELCGILFLVDVKWVFPETVKEVLASWRGSFVGKKRKKIWDTIPLCIFWTVRRCSPYRLPGVDNIHLKGGDSFCLCFLRP